MTLQIEGENPKVTYGKIILNQLFFVQERVQAIRRCVVEGIADKEYGFNTDTIAEEQKAIRTGLDIVDLLIEKVGREVYGGEPL